MAAPVFYIERDLFANSGDWISNKSDSINKPPSDYFEASDSTPAGTMLVTNGSLQAWGGALVSRKRGVPSNNGKLLNWMAYRLRFRFPAGTAKNTARHELDIKVCVKTRPNSNTKIRNVANFSCQWNADTGQFQIDLDPPAWVDTGFVVSEITPDVWHTLEWRYTYDDVALTFSVLSIQYDDQLYVIPEELQNVPMQNTNWEQVVSEQNQNEVYEARSTVAIEYSDGVLCWSDQRITMIPPEALTRAGVEREYWWPRQLKGTQVLVGGTWDPFGDDSDCDPRRESKVDVRTPKG
jgi:hypothetical protein